MRVWKKTLSAACAAFFLAAQLAGCSKAHEESQQQAKQDVPQEDAPRKIYSDEQHERHTWLKLLWNEQYAELDKTIAAAYAQRDRGELSSDRLRGRFWQLQQADPPSFLPRIERWVEQQNSTYAYLARGLILLRGAGEVRGEGLARDVSEETWGHVRNLAQRGVDDMNKALELDPRCAMCVGGKIWAGYFLKGRDPRLIDQALALDPTLSQPVLAHFGLLYPQWGGSEAEMLAFIKKMEAAPETAKFSSQLNAVFYYRRGLDFQARGKAAAAIKEYETALSFYPDSDALKNVAELYLQQGQPAKAAQALERNLEQDPWDLYTIEALAQAYIGQGESAKGKAMQEKRTELITRFRNGE